MTIGQFVFVVAGTLVLVSLALGLTVHEYWFALAAFVGLNMVQTAFTGFCPLAKILKALGVRPGPAFD